LRHGLPLDPKARRVTLMDGIYCNACGAKLDEAPTLLPDQRPPCPRCGSLARRFEQEVTNTVGLSDGGTASDTLSVAKTDGLSTIAHAEPATLTVTAHDASVSVQAHAGVAEGVGEALDATAQTVNAHGIPGTDQVGDATVVRDPRIIRDTW
jgi:hypothetical protein